MDSYAQEAVLKDSKTQLLPTLSSSSTLLLLRHSENYESTTFLIRAKRKELLFLNPLSFFSVHLGVLHLLQGYEYLPSETWKMFPSMRSTRAHLDEIRYEILAFLP